ncbi:pyridoxamine 5'-phosphate oxidase family protein [Saccharothrix sp. AJ9571]|nr:pyridoxamine 5'-phosphate oxidase family protein [Saccharothrix sp. AJ9571]
MSRREQIRMTADEARAYLGEQKVINVATIGPNGRPHLAPLWFFPHGDGFATWTYGSSQKVANLRRLPQATVLLESGDSYERLRGLSMETDVELVTDHERIVEIGTRLTQRYAGAALGDPVPPELAAFVGKQAEKRVGLVFTPTKTVSWDHTKLGGTY